MSGERWNKAILGKAYLRFEFVYERFQSVFGDISGEIDGRC